MAKRNDIFEITAGSLEGEKVKLIRESSYSYTFEVLQNKSPYRKGDKVNIAKYEAKYVCAANNYLL